MAPADGVNWEVTGQREDLQVQDNGQAASGMVVEFRVANGPSGSIFVPKGEYTLERVRQLIDARARTMAAVHALKG